ncbi:hypothetical protein [Micromonospora thermarum]|uniref:Copper resistance protein D domain-containing protein n=1 Tax=Micromonospora thermarum TaxID=2720024 RepID=A0ABX0Z1Y8_9ACTN|nr:hypothetical protein [Micromonospora thermarum]NJP31811.1 hypothetical protein [Micromonospora thermarum]
MTALDGSGRITRPRRSRTRRRTAPYLVALALLVAWTAMFLAAPHVAASTGVRQLALFAHLAALVLGFGAVLTLDWFALMWLLRRRTLDSVMQVARGVHPPIWLGLGGLALSGVVLAPDTSAPLTVVKLVAVLAVAINGLCARQVQRRLAELNGVSPPRRLLLTAALVMVISQAGWWTATAVGFLNAQR